MDVDTPDEHLEASSRSLWRGLISLVILVAIVAGLLLAIPGLHGVAERVGNMNAGWLLVAVGLEILSCVGYIIAFLQVFDRAPVRFGARVALTELAFGAAVSLGAPGALPSGPGCCSTAAETQCASPSAPWCSSCSPAPST